VSGYGAGIFPQHTELLAASAITPGAARDRGYVSVDSKAQLRRYDAKFSGQVPGPGTGVLH
jgi:hypothetical protein